MSLPIGVAFGETLANLSDPALGQVLDDVAALGAGWVRFDLAWSDVQPSRTGPAQWAPFDLLVQDAAARHLSVLPELMFTPAWARPAGCASRTCAPADPADFAGFAAAAASRYSPLGVHDWEIWNEPNRVHSWQPQPDVGAYVALARAAAAAIHQADPSATVISGGLAPSPTSAGDISQLDFLKGFAAQGGLGFVDAVGYHPYSYPAPPGYPAAWNAWAQIDATADSLHGVMASSGHPGMKLWLTEYGAPTNGPGAAATSSDYRIGQGADHVGEGLQAGMATDSVHLARASPDVGALFWYTATDAGTSPTTTANFFGLRRFDGSAKPAWDALRQAIAGG